MTIERFLPTIPNQCGAQNIPSIQSGKLVHAYTEASPCQSFYDSKSFGDVIPDCQTCWKRVLDHESSCPCVYPKNKDGLCDFSKCVSAYSSQCQNTYAALFQDFSRDDLKGCSSGSADAKETFTIEPKNQTRRVMTRVLIFTMLVIVGVVVLRSGREKK